MKITIKTDEENKEYISFKGEIDKPCCDEMKEALEENAIRFGEFDSIINEDTNLNFSKCSPYPEGAVFDEYPINFCPFCGEGVIKVNEVKSKLKKWSWIKNEI